MKELRVKQAHPQLGEVEIIMRIMGHVVYLKFSSNQYSEQMISQLQAKGALIIKGREWVRANIFGTNKSAKIGGTEIWLEEQTPEEIEERLFKFFREQYIKAKFEVVEDA